jgi:ubiquinone/menaquinone biosynthesis C-methylase UbiE
MQSPYTRIADLYDTFVQTDVDIPFFLDEARAVGGELLELMAGTGRVTVPLVEAGVRVTCLDNAPEMLTILEKKLKQRGLTAEVRLMDASDFSLDKQFDLIIIPFHAFPEITALADQQRALARIHAHLSAQGRFVCTLHNPGVRLRSVDGQLHLIANRALPDDTGRLLVWILQTCDAHSRLVTVTEFFEEYDTVGMLTAKRFTEIRFHLLEKSLFEASFRQAGFEPVALYGDYARSPFVESESPFMIWVLRKKA